MIFLFRCTGNSENYPVWNVQLAQEKYNPTVLDKQ